MSIPAPDALVGAIALEYVKKKLLPQLEDDPDFRGVFHVLSGFTPEQLVGFIQAKDSAGSNASLIKLQFPSDALSGRGLEPSYLTHSSSVKVRNENRGNGLITVAAEMEPDEGGSLADSDTTDASDLRDKSIANIWVDFVAKKIGLTLLPEDRRKVEAMLKGLFDTGRCPTTKAGEYLNAVLLNFRSEPLGRAAGKALPIIGLPLFEDCFSSLNEEKMGQPAQWATKFRGHYALECYLDRRGLAQELLDPEELRTRLSFLRSPEQQPPMPEDMLQAFSEYIESKGSRNTATETLLFSFDWKFTINCFEKIKKTSAKDFAERTRSALEAEAITINPDDEIVIQALTKIARKPGSASDEFKEFFERRTDALEKDTTLYVEWEDFIHGKRIECVDLFQGIFECIQRSIRGLSLTEEAYVVLEGREQKKPNSFLEVSQRACEYFERNYGTVEARSKRNIRFSETLVCTYTKDVLPKIKDKPKFKGSNKTGKSTTLNFLVSVFEKKPNGLDRKVVTLSLAWKFPIGSVLAQEGADFDALCRYHAQKGTTLVECVAEYEVVGGKGVPTPLSLESVEGFADVARGGGRGAFVPAQDRIQSLTNQWKQALKNESIIHWIKPNDLSALTATFEIFESAYNSVILELSNDALETGKVDAVADKYGALLLSINALRHQDARRQLLRIVLKVGLAQIPRSGRRPPMAVICPWHPVRLQALSARQSQVLGLLLQILSKNRPPFSDGSNGALFFRELAQLLAHPLYPELAIMWENTQAFPRVVAQAFGAYTLHEPPERSSSDDASSPDLDEESHNASATIEHEILEYLRLQPHERDNLSVLLYNCNSPLLPTSVAESINRINASREEDKITCQILLMHRDDEHLRQIYRDLVARGVDSEADSTEASGEFLAKVRVNITAASRFHREGRSQPIDIAYCRDLISQEAKPSWEWLRRETVSPLDLQPHQWSRRLPVAQGDRKVRLQLTCPAQTDSGWKYLYSVAVLCAEGADDAWEVGKCPVLMRCLDFDDQKVDRIFRETHDLATWVVNQDELLDRRLLEARDVKVIRYVQSATHGRNLIISSSSRETLLVNTLKEKLRALLASDATEETINGLCGKFMSDANKISGGLVLKAARRANNTNELLGMVLSRYLVESELGSKRAIAWCFLDDYSQWLGKKEGANIADLLVLAPKTNDDGTLHLDIVVTEAKFITHTALGKESASSAKQLIDTLSQLTEAMGSETPTIDQDIWLARLSDLLVSQTVTAVGEPPLDTSAWRQAIRQRKCTVGIWGYSHIFVNEPQNLMTQISTAKGVPAGKGRATIDSLQEIFGPGHVRELVLQYNASNYQGTADLRLRNGHPAFGKSKLYDLSASARKPSAAPHTQDGKPPENPEGGAGHVVLPESPTAPTGSTSGIPVKADNNPPDGETSSGNKSIPSEQGAVIDYLKARAALFQTSEADGLAWLESTTAELRRSLVARGLPAKLIDGHPPILTPNAGIIKLQGSKELTVQAVDSRTEEIYTSDGLKIINTTPESGRVSIAIERPQRQVLHTEPVLLEYLLSYITGTLGEKLCIGVREEDGKPMLLDPFNQPHTLIAGITGSGKSVLMQNLILTIAATRSPDEATIYLIDPKFGVDYRPLDELPHVQAGSKGIVDDSSSAISILENLVEEMNRRYELFKESKTPNILAYRRKTGQVLPTIWVFHDEFADWMQTDTYAEAVPNIVGRLSVKARAAGIFLIFAAQRPDKDVMPMQLRSQLGNRLILKVDNAATAEISMGVKNSGAERLLGRGHMLAKTGDTPDAVFVQVPYIDLESTIPQIVQLICTQYAQEK